MLLRAERASLCQNVPKGLADSGQSIEEIAAIFVIEPKQVKRILALANLNPEILALYEAEDIGQPTVRALTLATPEQQIKWLALFNNEDEYAPQGGNLKEWLTGGAQIETSAAIFELDGFEGTIITDLFGDTDYFVDPQQFWPLQNGEVAKLKDMWMEAGWSEVVILERGAYFDSYEYGQRTMEQGGKIYVRIGHDGTVKPHIGYLPKSDIKKIDNILGLNIEGGSKKANEKPEMSGPMAQYIALHRHGAIRSQLLNHPQVALRLTVATKVQKAIIREALKGTGTRKHKPDWRPRWMQVPPSHYIDKTTCPPAQADSHVSKVMMSRVKAKDKKAA